MIIIRALPTYRSSDYIVPVEGNAQTRFYINVCHDVLYHDGGLNNTEIGAYQLDLDTNSGRSIGSTTKNVVERSSGNLLLLMSDGAPCDGVNKGRNRQTLVHLHCDAASKDSLPVYLFDDNCTYVFTWATSVACTGGGNWPTGGGMSGWGVLATMYDVRNERVIPICCYDADTLLPRRYL